MSAPGQSAERPSKALYVEAVGRIEQLHRRLLDALTAQFDSMGWIEITPAQALLLFNIGDAEVTAGELRSRGWYNGTNASYNLNKLVQGQYLTRRTAPGDARSTLIRLTPKGQEVAETVDELYDRHIGSIRSIPGLDAKGLAELNAGLARFDLLLGQRNRFDRSMCLAEDRLPVEG